MRTVIATVFLLAQLGSVIYARFIPERYFCWAPNDYVVEYKLNVSINGQALTPPQVLARYHIGPDHAKVVEHPVEHLINDIEQYETTYGRNDHAQVQLTWKYNGYPDERHWQWPK